MRHALRYLVFAMSTSCTGSATREEPPMTSGDAESDGLRPTWHVGDAWSVRYRILVPSWYAVADPPPLWEDYVWSFRVKEETAEGTFAIEARNPVFRDEGWLLTFNANGHLRSVDPPGADDLEFNSSGPWFPPEIDWASQLIVDWPAYPLPSLGTEKRYSGDVRQRTEGDGTGWKVFLERSVDFHGKPLTKKMEQVWEAGRPWWTTMSIGSFDAAGKQGNEAHGELLPPTKER